MGIISHSASTASDLISSGDTCLQDTPVDCLGSLDQTLLVSGLFDDHPLLGPLRADGGVQVDPDGGGALALQYRLDNVSLSLHITITLTLHSLHITITITYQTLQLDSYLYLH